MDVPAPEPPLSAELSDSGDEVGEGRSPDRPVTVEPSPAPAGHAGLDSDPPLRAVLDSARIGTWQWFPATDGIVASPALEAMHGLAPGGFPRTFAAYRGVIHGDDRARVVRALVGSVREGTAHDLEYRIIHPDGTTRWVVTRGRVFRDEHGAPTCLSACYDVTDRKHAEHALQAAHQHLHILTDRLSIPVTRCSRQLTYLWASRPYADWVGQAPEQLVGRPIADILGSEAFDRLLPYFTRVLSGQQVDYEEEVPFRGLGRRWVNAVYTPTFDTAGVPDGWVAVVIDITDGKRLQRRQALQLAVTGALARASNADEALTGILQGVCEALHWGTAAIWTLDRDLQAMRCSHFWHAPAVAVPEFEAATRARTFVRGVGLPGRVWASGQPAWIADVVADGNFPRAPFAARDDLHGAFGFPITLRGEIIGMMEFFSRAIEKPDDDLLASLRGIGTHIGQFLERRRTEERLRESEARKTAVLETALDAVITIDHEGRVVEFNAAAERIFGYSRDEAVGRIMADLIVPVSERARHQRGIAHYLATGEGPLLNRRLELRAVRSDGSEFPVEVAITRLAYDGPALFTGYIRDITERKAAETALLEADRRKDEFLATLAHELRNPLAPIRMAAHFMHVADLPDDRVRRARDIIERQVLQMTRLIDDLLDVSRITRGKITLHKEPVDLATALADAVEATRPLIDAAAHRLHVTPPSSPIYLDADPTRLAQIFSNLLSNAAKFTDRGGDIWLTAEREGDEAAVTVRDTGIGIAPEHLLRIFDMFSQVVPALERSQGGLGIGLALVRALVELHEGGIEARSDGPGQGSTFIVRLPISEVPSRGGTRDEADALLQATAPRRILVVDDNRDSTDTLTMMLTLAGHEVQTAHDGLEAMRVAESFHPEVVLLDIGLPKMNGYEVAARVREQPWGGEVLLVAVTGWGHQEDKQRARDAGFDHHVTKPMDAAALARLLAGVEKRTGS